LKYFDAKLRFAQPFLAKFKWTINWSLSPQGLKTRKVDSVASEEPREGRESNFMMLFVVAGKALERKKSPLRGYANSSWHHPYSFYCFGLSREPSSASFSHCILCSKFSLKMTATAMKQQLSIAIFLLEAIKYFPARNQSARCILLLEKTVF